MPNTEAPITGDDFTKVMDDLGLKIKDVANYWEIDRNTVRIYREHGSKPLPRNKMMRILVDDLKLNFGKQ